MQLPTSAHGLKIEGALNSGERGMARLPCSICMGAGGGFVVASPSDWEALEGSTGLSQDVRVRLSGCRDNVFTSPGTLQPGQAGPVVLPSGVNMQGPYPRRHCVNQDMSGTCLSCG